MSRRTGVSLRSLRYYEEKQLLRPARLDNGYREYSESDIEKIEFIRLYFSLGLTANEIMSFFDCVFRQETPRECLPNAIKLGEQKLGDIRKQIEVLRKAETQLEAYLSGWKDLLDQKEDPDE